MMVIRRVVLPAVLALAASSIGVVITGVAPALADPGTPGVPQAPQVLYTEDFENGQGATPIQLPSYTGAPPVNETYSSDPAYLINCNGWIASPLDPSTEPPGSGCGGFWPELPRLAGSLDQFAGTGAGTNHALGWETAGIGPGANKVQLQTNNPVPVPANRFLSFSVDAADGSCNGLHALFQFFLLDGSTAIPTNSSPIEPCANPQLILGEDHIGTYVSDNPVLFGGSSAGIRLANAQGGAFGNDAAVDNIKLLDVSPQLDKTFSAAVVPEHGTVRLIYTITNTTELAAKSGWSFVDAFPTGLTADPASVQTTCPGFASSFDPGQVVMAGSLGAGQISCTISVELSASAPGAYTTCAGNMADLVGVKPPGCATVRFNAEPVVNAGGPYAGQEGSPVAIAGTVSDVDGPTLSSSWSVAASTGVDPGATCSIADPAAVTTTVSCTDDGVYTLTLTASDGINPPVSASTALTLSNVAPAVSISSPANGSLFVRGTAVSFTAPFTDIGTNDTHTCAIDFADGTPVTAGTVTESPGTGTCRITHTFTALGAHNVLVRVTDDDGGAGTAVVRVVIYLPGEAFALQANGLITIPKTPLATCPPDESKTIASLSLGIGSVTALHAECTVDLNDGTTRASATVGSANLLGGLIRITDISSTCVAGASGITRSSTVGSINGIPIGLGSGSLGIPGVATVFYNETTTIGGRPAQNAIRISTLLGQEIILAGCRLG
ncbi:MAG TPA: choice-of-anchor P family protein [Actinophytocola sp.]|uniref:choice-of-anchor P family protein n=1 Tax=Actinophytocola sp. TaxID=1872138 RepID=UPI002DF82C32|nr:choice-of-anchor P family protein [Actinophytocola sp.]